LTGNAGLQNQQSADKNRDAPGHLG